MAFPRDGRIKRLNDELKEAKSDAALLRAGHMRLLQTLSERDQATHERSLAEDRVTRSADQNRILIAALVLRHGAFELSDAEQKDGFRHADQVQILPDEATGATRFSLLEGVALRELPRPPLALVPPPADTPGSEPAAGTDEPSPEPGHELHAGESPDASKEPPQA
jgi:hypothetical protein